MASRGEHANADGGPVNPNANTVGNYHGFASMWEEDSGGLRARNQNGTLQQEIYFCGIIDVLQEYDIKKWLEHEYKKNKQKKMGQDPQAISAVKASTYAKRFVDYISRNLA
jgi:hypothetical protein